MLLTIPIPTVLYIIIYIHSKLSSRAFYMHTMTPNDIYTPLHLCFIHMDLVLSNIIDGLVLYYNYSGALLLIHYICLYLLSTGFTLLITSLLTHDTLAHYHNGNIILFLYIMSFYFQWMLIEGIVLLTQTNSILQYSNNHSLTTCSSSISSNVSL